MKRILKRILLAGILALSMVLSVGATTPTNANSLDDVILSWYELDLPTDIKKIYKEHLLNMPTSTEICGEDCTPCAVFLNLPGSTYPVLLTTYTNQNGNYNADSYVDEGTLWVLQNNKLVDVGIDAYSFGLHFVDGEIMLSAEAEEPSFDAYNKTTYYQLVNDHFVQKHCFESHTELMSYGDSDEFGNSINDLKALGYTVSDSGDVCYVSYNKYNGKIISEQDDLPSIGDDYTTLVVSLSTKGSSFAHEDFTPAKDAFSDVPLAGGEIANHDVITKAVNLELPASTAEIYYNFLVSMPTYTEYEETLHVAFLNMADNTFPVLLTAYVSAPLGGMGEMGEYYDFDIWTLQNGKMVKENVEGETLEVTKNGSEVRISSYYLDDGMYWAMGTYNDYQLENNRLVQVTPTAFNDEKSTTLILDRGPGWSSVENEHLESHREVLYHLKNLAENSTITFLDIPANASYKDAVAWAVEQKITSGTTATTFSPDKTCTRAEVATFLWRASGSPEPKTNNNPFADVKTTDWYYKPILWAVEQGITSGTSVTTFSPKKTCTSAEVITFLWRANNSPAPSGSVDENQYYAKAVAWAKEQTLTEPGFQVSSNSPRKDIVQYLYKNAN